MMSWNYGHEGASQVQADCMGKIKLWGMEIFYLILEVSNLLDMTYGSRDEREPLPAERKAQWPTNGSGRETPLWVASTRIHRWGSRDQLWMELITED